MKCYDSGKESKYITYLHVNNLYGYAMSQYLPYSEFKWLNKTEMNRFCLNSMKEIVQYYKLTLNILVNCIECIMITL